MNSKSVLLDLLSTRAAKIGIVGLGYVGVPLALRYAEVGYKVIGFDIDPRKVEKINSKQSYIEHIDDSVIEVAVNQGLEATSEYLHIAEVDAIIICVPTPLNEYREPDLSYVTSTLDSISSYLRTSQVLSLESTTYPGTSEELILPVLIDAGFDVGEDFFLVYSPEREDPGNPNFTTKTIPKVCGGYTNNCMETGVALYNQVVNEVVEVSSLATAELAKLLENIHRAVNIGLVNEMKVVAEEMGIDIYEVISAAATKPFGFVPYYPGPGLGGHCIPIDPFYLTWKAREYGLHTRFIELAGEINTSMPGYVVARTIEGLNNASKSVKGSRILILGVSYKKNVGDVRESPSTVIIEKLLALGARVEFSDPHVDECPTMRKHNISCTSVALDEETIAGYDCVILATDHDAFNYGDISNYANLIIDCRGKFKPKENRVIRA